MCDRPVSWIPVHLSFLESCVKRLRYWLRCPAYPRAQVAVRATQKTQHEPRTDLSYSDWLSGVSVRTSLHRSHHIDILIVMQELAANDATQVIPSVRDSHQRHGVQTALWTVGAVEGGSRFFQLGVLNIVQAFAVLSRLGLAR